MRDALNVRWSTPAMAPIVPLAAGAVGRPLTHLTHRLADFHPLADADRVLATGEPARRRVATVDGRWFVQSTRP